MGPMGFIPGSEVTDDDATDMLDEPHDAELYLHRTTGVFAEPDSDDTDDPDNPGGSAIRSTLSDEGTKSTSAEIRSCRGPRQGD